MVTTASVTQHLSYELKTYLNLNIFTISGQPHPLMLGHVLHQFPRLKEPYSHKGYVKEKKLKFIYTPLFTERGSQSDMIKTHVTNKNHKTGTQI